jgi:hypothetical protein
MNLKHLLPSAWFAHCHSLPRPPHLFYLRVRFFVFFCRIIDSIAAFADNGRSRSLALGYGALQRSYRRRVDSNWSTVLSFEEAYFPCPMGLAQFALGRLRLSF